MSEIDDIYETKLAEALALSDASLKEGREVLDAAKERIEQVLVSDDPALFALLGLLIKSLIATSERYTQIYQRSAGVLASIKDKDRTTWLARSMDELNQIWEMKDMALDASARARAVVDRKIAEGNQ